MNATDGRAFPPWDLLAEQDRSFAEVLDRLIDLTFSFGEVDAEPVLPIKTKQLIAVAVLASQRNTERLPFHLQRALNEGATDREAVEAFEIAMMLSGVPALRVGMQALWHIRNDEGTA